jgi:hypothetical protein
VKAKLSRTSLTTTHPISNRASSFDRPSSEFVSQLDARIANVLAQSGSIVPDWILKLPKPSKLKRRQMGKTKRDDIVTFAGRVGRAEAIRKRYVLRELIGHAIYLTYLRTFRDMVAGSKRRAENPFRSGKSGEVREEVDSDASTYKSS